MVVAADDPGMASSQNEQDSRRYAIAAGLPMLEPADSQEAYELALAALELSQRWQLPVILRMTTRVCHSKSIVTRRAPPRPAPVPRFARDIAGRVMIPAYARPAHRLRKKLASLEAWADTAPVTIWREGDRALGVIANGVAARHAREAAPEASLLELKLVHPLPLEKIRAFAASVERCVVIEEGDPVIADAVRAAGIAVEAKPAPFRFGELERPPRAPHPRARPLARARGAEGQAAAALRGLPLPPGLRIPAQARLHRRGRHRLLHARRPPAVPGDGHLRRDGRLARRGARPPARAARGGRPPGGVDHRRLDVRPHRR